MVIRYEANPPKIIPGTNSQEAISKFITKIKTISKECDGIHLTENVLGQQRVSPIQIGKMIKKEIPGIVITVSLRVRDKTQQQINDFVDECIHAEFAGILVLMGDPLQNHRSDTKQIPSKVVKHLVEVKQNTTKKTVDLYLSVSNDLAKERKIQSKIQAHPNGFITQVVDSVSQVKNIQKGLAGHHIIPIVLFPSSKNKKSAEFLDINMQKYEKKDVFAEFVRNVHDTTNDVLITSPNDFTGLYKFLKEFTL